MQFRLLHLHARFSVAFFLLCNEHRFLSFEMFRECLLLRLKVRLLLFQIFFVPSQYHYNLRGLILNRYIKIMLRSIHAKRLSYLAANMSFSLANIFSWLSVNSIRNCSSCWFDLRIARNSVSCSSFICARLNSCISRWCCSIILCNSGSSPFTVISCDINNLHVIFDYLLWHVTLLYRIKFCLYCYYLSRTFS